MKYEAENVAHYLEQLPESQKEKVTRLRDLLKSTLEPLGFEETMQYNMISYVVPYSLYPAGYHCKPKQPLPFISLAGQKNYIAVYHLGIYSDPVLLNWFQTRFYDLTGKSVDMGKSCIRLKGKLEIPYDLFQELALRITPDQWIATYEQSIRRSANE